MILDKFGEALTSFGVAFERNNGHIEVQIADFLPISSRTDKPCDCLVKMLGEAPKLIVRAVDHPQYPDALEMELISTFDAYSEELDPIALAMANVMSNGAIMPSSDEDSHLAVKYHVKGEGLIQDMVGKDHFVGLVRMMTCELCNATP